MFQKKEENLNSQQFLQRVAGSPWGTGWGDHRRNWWLVKTDDWNTSFRLWHCDDQFYFLFPIKTKTDNQLLVTVIGRLIITVCFSHTRNDAVKRHDTIKHHQHNICLDVYFLNYIIVDNGTLMLIDALLTVCPVCVMTVQAAEEVEIS